MKKAFGAILIAVILIVCVVTLTVQRGETPCWSSRSTPQRAAR